MKILSNKKGEIYVYGVLVLAIFMSAFLWFIMYAVVDPVRDGIASSMEQYDVANSTYQSFELADTFMTNLWIYMLVLAMFISLIWVIHYASRKSSGVPVVYG